MAFESPASLLTIGSLDDESLEVEAQYNPKDLQITQPIKWNEHKPINHQKTDALALEFGAMEPQTLKVELFFDGFETDGQLENQESCVAWQVLRLKQLASVIDPYSPHADERRPHFCVLTWGKGDQNLRPLCCIIENLTTTYQVFSPTGTILRATVAVSLKEANRVDYTQRDAADR